MKLSGKVYVIDDDPAMRDSLDFPRQRHDQDAGKWPFGTRKVRDPGWDRRRLSQVNSRHGKLTTLR